MCHAVVTEQPEEGDRRTGVAVNALLHSQGTSQERAAEAEALMHQGYNVLKIKVRLESAEDQDQESKRQVQHFSQHSAYM